MTCVILSEAKDLAKRRILRNIIRFFVAVHSAALRYKGAVARFLRVAMASQNDTFVISTGSGVSLKVKSRGNSTSAFDIFAQTSCLPTHMTKQKACGFCFTNRNFRFHNEGLFAGINLAGFLKSCLMINVSAAFVFRLR